MITVRLQQKPPHLEPIFLLGKDAAVLFYSVQSEYCAEPAEKGDRFTLPHTGYVLTAEGNLKHDKGRQTMDLVDGSRKEILSLPSNA